MVGALGEGFFLDAFFAGTLDKVSDFEIVFEFKIFFGHCWHPSFAGLPFFLPRNTQTTRHICGIKFVFFSAFPAFRVDLVFLKIDDIQPFWQMPSPLVRG